jgi:hypothetical protein
MRNRVDKNRGPKELLKVELFFSALADEAIAAARDRRFMPRRRSRQAAARDW